MVTRAEVEAGYRQMQEDLVAVLETCDGAGSFGRDDWSRLGGGGGLTRILTGGRHLEKAAVNFSAVHGETPEALSERMTAASDHFYATGVSVIVHPRNPYAPTFHANVRYLEAGGQAWFGGGADLTPYYLFAEDASHFHRVLASVCDRHAFANYEGWKKSCDEYFRLHHRDEARGVGGIFFDHLTNDLEAVWSFQRDLAGSLPDAYITILRRRVGMPYGEEQARWHRIRRARYVEFNLVWDRGTRFGLETGGRTESILASLPPVAEWEHGHRPEPGSPEADLLDLLTGPPREWT